jgi:hypothetical protein
MTYQYRSIAAVFVSRRLSSEQLGPVSTDGKPDDSGWAGLAALAKGRWAASLGVQRKDDVSTSVRCTYYRTIAGFNVTRREVNSTDQAAIVCTSTYVGKMVCLGLLYAMR